MAVRQEHKENANVKEPSEQAKMKTRGPTVSRENEDSIFMRAPSRAYLPPNGSILSSSDTILLRIIWLYELSGSEELAAAKRLFVPAD